MKKHEILSPQARALLFDPPTDPASIVRNYTFSSDDLMLIRQRRRDENRLGFAVLLAYFRYPGRAINTDERPPTAILEFIAEQLDVPSESFAHYATRAQTREEHLLELQDRLKVRFFEKRDHQVLIKVAKEEAIGTDRGDAIVAAMINALRKQGILLPSATELERVALTARANARETAYKTLTTGLDPDQSQALESLLVVNEANRTPLAWLRKWPEKVTQANLVGIIERLQAVRDLGIEADREYCIHRARYAAIVRETPVLTAQHMARFDDQRRLATLVVFAREMEAILIDAGISMFDKMLVATLRKSDREHKEHEVERAKTLNGSTRGLLKMAKAILTAKKKDGDLDAAVEDSIGWDRLAILVQGTAEIISGAREDNLTEFMGHYRSVRRMAQLVLTTFTFHSWKTDDPLLAAIDTLREIYTTGRRDLPTLIPTNFFSPQWRKLVGFGSSFDQRAYEMAVIVHLRERLRAGDIWVVGSRAFRTFDDFLLPPAVFAASRSEDRLGLAIPSDFQAWRNQYVSLLEDRLEAVDQQASENRLPEAIITENGLSLSPIRSTQPDAAHGIGRRLYNLLPRLRITDLLAEVNTWTGLASRFVHLQSGTPPPDEVALMSAILADATNLGLARMARSSGVVTHPRLLWTAQWHIRDETYAGGLACLVEAIHAQPFTGVWGDGETSSSDGQFFRAGGRGEASADHNARYGSEPGVKFYTHVSDRFAPFHTKVIAANASEATYVLDGLLHHETSLDIKEHYTDTGGTAEYVFGLCHLLGFRFAPRIRDLADRKLFITDSRKIYPALQPMIGGVVNLQTVEENWDEVLRMAASLRAGTVPASTLLRKLVAYPRQNALSKALREISRLERTLFTLDWITDPALRRRAQAGLNKGESRNALARTLFFHRHGEIRDRTFENQCYRASGLNLVVAAIVLWNTVYLSRAVDELRARGEEVPEELLTHVAPLGWEHISFNGDYIWPAKPLMQQYPPLRTARLSLMEAA